MRSFREGDEIEVIKEHRWEGRKYDECEIGDFGKVVNVYGSYVEVEWDRRRQGQVRCSLIDLSCLRLAPDEPTEDEIAELFGIFTPAPCPHCNGTGKKAGT